MGGTKSSEAPDDLTAIVDPRTEPDEREVLRLISWIESRSLEAMTVLSVGECPEFAADNRPGRF